MRVFPRSAILATIAEFRARSWLKEVSVDHRLVAAVQVDQTLGQVCQNGSLQGERDVRVVIQQVINADEKTFHDQHRQGGVGEETYSQKLDQVGVPQVCHQLTFFNVPASYILSAKILLFNQGLMELLPSTQNPAHFQLLHTAVGAGVIKFWGPHEYRDPRSLIYR